MERGFKKKTINKIIKSKTDNWLKSIDNEELRDEIRQNLICTGGAIASMLMGEEANDYDFYIQDRAVCRKLVEYYISTLPDNVKPDMTNVSITDTDLGIETKIRSAGIVSDGETQENYEYFEMNDTTGERTEEYLDAMIKNNEKKAPYSVAMITSNAISLTKDVQIITRFCGGPEVIHENFDFLHAMNYWTYADGVVLRQDALECILSKELKYIGSRYPICSIFRIKKFVQRGWSITAGEMFKIAWDISKLNLNDHDTLRDQLTGVDTAYFHEVISIIEQEKDASKELDRTYLFDLINRIF